MSSKNQYLRSDDDIHNVLEKYSDTVYKIAFSQTKNKSDAEDVFQNVFIRYMRCHTAFQDENHLKAWLIRVTINCCKSLLTSAWFRKTIGFSEDVGDMSGGEFCQSDDYEIYNIVKKLPAKYGIVIHLHYYEDMSIGDIAKILGNNENTVKSRLFRGRKMLKEKILKEKSEGDGDYVEGKI